MSNVISMDQYTNQGDGFGYASAQDLAEFQKAMTAGDQTGRDLDGVDTTGASLKVESLENLVRSLESKEQHYVAWKKLAKLPAYNTVEEYTLLKSYGDNVGGFTNEGELPEEEDSLYERKSGLVKYLGVTGSVSHPLQLVRTQPGLGGILAKEVKNKTNWIMRRADTALNKGDSRIVPQEFDGYYAQHEQAFSTLDAYYASEQVIDLRGANLDEATLGDATQIISENFGYADTVLMPPSVKTNFSKQFLSQKHIYPQAQHVVNPIMGQKVDLVQTDFGVVNFTTDIFWTRGKAKTTATAAEHSKVPAKPVADATTPIAVVTDATALFGAAGAGDYYYAVAAVNRYGESALTVINASAQAVTATQAVNLQFAAGSGAYAATGFVIYRSEKDVTETGANIKYYPIFKISAAQLTAGYDGGSAGLVRDKNRVIANTEDCLVYQDSQEISAFKQLAPIMKMNLAVLSPSTRFMVLLYGVLQLYMPTKVVRIRNIGKFTG